MDRSGGVTYALAAVMALTACFCAARLWHTVWDRCPGHRDADVAGVAMATVMAIGLAGAPDIPTVPTAFGFSAAAIWFGWRCMHAYVIDGSRVPSIAVHLRHGVLSAAMAAMVVGSVAATGGQPSTMAGMGAGSAAARLAMLSVLVPLALVAARDCVVFVRGPSPSAERVLGSPRLAVGCELAMTATMGYLLLSMH